MGFNKQELREKINKLPLFEKRDVFVANSTDEYEIEKTKQFQEAICEVGKNKAWAYVTPNYKLLQFNELFTPILDSIQEEVTGFLVSHGGFAALKFFPEIDQLREGNDQFGLIAMNSVDKSSSIVVKFCVKHDERYFTIPSRKPHTGKAADLTKNYIKFLGTVKETWKTVINKFPNYHITYEEGKISEDEDIHYLQFKSVADKLKLGVRMDKKVREYYEQITLDDETFSLWDFFMKVFELIEDLNFKSDAHKERRIDVLCKKLFEYSMILEL